MDKSNKDNMESKSIISIEEYLCNTNPQQLIDLKNLFLENKIKIIK